MLANILLYVGLFLGGAIAGLKVIAPLTKTKIDDEVLEYGEDAVKVLESLGIKVPGHVDPEKLAVVAPKAD